MVVLVAAVAVGAAEWVVLVAAVILAMPAATGHRLAGHSKKKKILHGIVDKGLISEILKLFVVGLGCDTE